MGWWVDVLGVKRGGTFGHHCRSRRFLDDTLFLIILCTKSDIDYISSSLSLSLSLSEHKSFRRFNYRSTCFQASTPSTTTHIRPRQHGVHERYIRQRPSLGRAFPVHRAIESRLLWHGLLGRRYHNSTASGHQMLDQAERCSNDCVSACYG